MGGQACVFYGAAQFSKDIDFLVSDEEENISKLDFALKQLQAKRVSFVPFDQSALHRGHAANFRCASPDLLGLRIDILCRHRNLPEFYDLWDRRTEFGDLSEVGCPLLSITDLVESKKTQRPRDWPVIEALVTFHNACQTGSAARQWIDFWLLQGRSAEFLSDLVQRFSSEVPRLAEKRPLLNLAVSGDLPRLREALDAEVRAEQEKDRVYWEPLKREMEEFRRLERLSQ